MALITCPDCGKDVSDAAPACIYCGRPLRFTPAPIAAAPVQPQQIIVNTEQQYGCGTLLMIVFCVVAIVFMFGGIGTCASCAALLRP